MARGWMPGAAIALAGALLLPTTVCGADFFGFRRANYSTSPHSTVAGPPGPHRYEGNDAARAPWYGYGFGVPTYQWGYFGVRYRGATLGHQGYYKDYTQWSYRQGY